MRKASRHEQSAVLPLGGNSVRQGLSLSRWIVTDAKIRQAEHDDGLALVERLRAGDLWPAYTSAREVPCPKCEPIRKKAGATAPGWSRSISCLECNGAGPMPCDPLDVVRLLAFYGVEEARDLMPGLGCNSQGSCACDYHPDPQSLDREDHVCLDQDHHGWLVDLPRLAAKLPPKRVEVICPACLRDRFRDSMPGPITPARLKRCGCDKTVAHDGPAEQWLLVAACVAVAREIVKEYRKRGSAQEVLPGWQDCLRAIDACQAWVDEPTPEHHSDYMHRWAAAECPWLPLFSNPARALIAAAEVITPERVRELVKNTLLAQLLTTRNPQ